MTQAEIYAIKEGIETLEAIAHARIAKIDGCQKLVKERLPKVGNTLAIIKILETK